MEISNPRRVLLIGPPDGGHLELLKELTGTQPIPTTDTLAGLSHTITLKTSYYSATVPIWLDILSPSSPSTWSSDFLAPEAEEVLHALGALIVIFKKPVTPQDYDEIKTVLKEVGKVVKACDSGAGGWDGVVLAVGMKQDIVPGLDVGADDWEDVCREEGFEWVDAEGKGINEFREAQGLARVKEALESNDWEGDDVGEDLDLDGIDGSDDDNGIIVEALELESEMFGMKQAIYGGADDGSDAEGSNMKNENEEDEVEQLEGMMLRMQAMKDLGADLPEAERKRFAAKAVRDLMKKI